MTGSLILPVFCCLKARNSKVQHAIPKSLDKYTLMGNCDNYVKIVVYTCAREGTPKKSFIYYYLFRRTYYG